jgi:hypothetical protein
MTCPPRVRIGLRRYGQLGAQPTEVSSWVPRSGFPITVRLSQLSDRHLPPCLALRLLLGLGPKFRKKGAVIKGPWLCSSIQVRLTSIPGTSWSYTRPSSSYKSSPEQGTGSLSTKQDAVEPPETGALRNSPALRPSNGCGAKVSPTRGSLT